MLTIKDRARVLQEQKIFLGGPPGLFERAGRIQLIILLSEGLYPNSKVLDVGCGCLRGGYWLIHFLDRGCYCGIEPNRQMLEAGKNALLEPDLMDLKEPRFDHNSEFDFSVFGQQFDFVLARSIWTHASKSHILTMLDGFKCFSREGATFLTSYVPASWLKNNDYTEAKWVGRSHQSDGPGIVCHKFGWIKQACQQRGLTVEEIREKAFNFGGQMWLRIRHEPA